MLSFGSGWGSCDGSGVQEVKPGVEAIQFVGQPGVVVWDSSTLPLAWSRPLGQQHSASSLESSSGTAALFLL